MGLSRRSSRSLQSLLTVVFVLCVCVVLAVKAYQLLDVYQQYKAVDQLLPELPVVRSGTRERSAGFPVIWLQQVDGIERAVLMAPHYKGMEIDVVYNAAADLFDVGHPPVPSQGISLDRLFASIPQVEDHFFWIDFKNLTE